MKNIEYTKMASLYDLFYKNKDYDKEVGFICKFIKSKHDKILDAGAGTGNHAKILNDLGYDICGFDNSQDMVDIANSKINGKFFQSDLLNFNLGKKYDVIISFFAVFNHLKNYKEFKKALLNLKNVLNDNGTIIIDLHNPQRSGIKVENFDNVTRIMKWKKCTLCNKEFSKITYVIEEKMYKTSHIFKIYNIGKLRRIVNELGFKNVKFYANYDINIQADFKSKNIQMILEV